jgi:putative hydrolase of the HAD superfamily
MNIKYILFDAANTLIHKPALWPSMQFVLEQHGYAVPVEKLQLHHKILSEAISFPDRTSIEFYHSFNAELLISLGIIPSEQLLNDIYKACSYLPWEGFEDTEWLNDCKLPIGVLSNFNNNLPGILQGLFNDIFSHIIVSESLQKRKPDIDFFQRAMEVIDLPANDILYIGDSLKLDIIPGKKIGFNTLLIDRLGVVCKSGEVINKFTDIPLYL